MTLPEAHHRTVFLVSCVREKLPQPAPAGELYRSPWFLKARRYVESHGGRWFILSARYGLVAPGDRIAPYDRTLLKLAAASRREWANAVFQRLMGVIVPGDVVVFLAGARYREYLQPPLEKHGYTVEVPMKGLGIGKQLHWLDSHA